MSVTRKGLHSDATTIDCMETKNGWLQRFHKNQRGTTLTEFLITLPIFILIFVSMVRLGQFELTGGQLWGHAYKDTWSKALPVSESQIVPVDPTHIHINPRLAGSEAISQLSQHSTHNDISTLESRIQGYENKTYAGLQTSGHWGESLQRTAPSTTFLHFKRVGSHLTSDPSKIVGSSSFTRSLVDDSGGMVHVNGVGSGPAAAVAAGIRYGTVFGLGEINPVIMGVEIPMYVHFNTLVAPMPYNDSVKTMETVHSLMRKQGHYENIYGISLSQPLSGGSGSVSVPDKKWDLD